MGLSEPAVPGGGAAENQHGTSTTKHATALFDQGGHVELLPENQHDKSAMARSSTPKRDTLMRREKKRQHQLVLSVPGEPGATNQHEKLATALFDQGGHVELLQEQGTEKQHGTPVTATLHPHMHDLMQREKKQHRQVASPEPGAPGPENQHDKRATARAHLPKHDLMR